MSLLRLKDVYLRFDSQLVLREGFLRVEAGECVGLIGKNGTGKTSVLRLILGRLAPTQGEVELREGTRVGYFSQFSQLDGQGSVESLLDGLFEETRAIEEELASLEAKFAESPQGRDLERLVERQTALLAEMERRDGWSIDQRIDTVLTRLGFGASDRARPVDELSAGWRNRAALAHLLLQGPDLLLLDEPTNYLDIDGLCWLEEWIQKIRAAVIVVSHDRQFLDSVVGRIVEIENHHFHEYAGGYTEYVRLRRLRGKTLERQFLHEEELLALESEALSDRTDPGRRLRRKLADAKKRVEPRPPERIVTDIYRHLRCPQQLLEVRELARSRDERVLFQDLSFSLTRGERLAVVGPNGCGKTSLLRVLTGEEPPDAGSASWRPGVEFVDFDRVRDGLDDSDTVSHCVYVAPLAFHQTRRQANRFLAMLGFSEAEHRQQIGTLSGGQRARVALAAATFSGAQVMVLDEPTNHLDVASTRVMELTLAHFPGAVVVVSHDRLFLDQVATRLLVFGAAGGVELVDGSYSQWEASRLS